MSERAVVEAASVLTSAGEPFVIATVVAVTGSAYRQPGARMLLTRDRWVAGSVSGGCLEGDLVHKAWWRTENGKPAVVTYDSSVDDDEAADDELRQGLGLGCNGIVDILLERSGMTRVDPLAFIACCHRAQERGSLVTVFGSDVPEIPVGARLAVSLTDIVGDLVGTELQDAVLADAHHALVSGQSVVRSYRIAGGIVRTLVEAVVPPPRLFVLGAGHDAIPVVELARAIGWEVFLCAPRARASIRTRFGNADHLVFGSASEIAARVDTCDRAAVIVMNHQYEHDRACLTAMLRSRARYIGVLGPRRRTARMLAEVGEAAIDDRLHAPVGLDLGAETPQQIALAIIAEAQAVLAHAAASPLRERPGTIHEPGRDDHATVVYEMP
jgi:xanthine dehydrogenase accessory factor